MSDSTPDTREPTVPSDPPALAAAIETGYLYVGERGRRVARTITVDGINLDVDNQGYAIGLELVGSNDFYAAAWRVLTGARFA